VTHRILLPLLLTVAVSHGCASTKTAESGDAEIRTARVESREPAYLDSEAEETEPGDVEMTTERMTELLEEFDDAMKQQRNLWQLDVDGVQVIVVADPHADRMRVVAPIKEVAKLQPKQMHIMLEANFHTALDARYATSKGMVYAAFLHPLSSLSDEYLRSAVRQVVSLVQTFGSSYSSGELAFPG
jgi:hypothetical protein